MNRPAFPFRAAISGAAALALAAGGWSLWPTERFTTASIMPSPAGDVPSAVGPDGTRPAPSTTMPPFSVHPTLAVPPAIPQPPVVGTPPRPAGDITILKAGLEALEAGDLAGAIGARNQLRFGSLDHDLLTWTISVSNHRALPSEEIETATRILGEWPGMEGLRRNTERAALRENAAPEAVLALFAGNAPETVEGARILARTHLILGNTDAARLTLLPFWLGSRLDPATESAILKEFSTTLTREDHRTRMELMLYNDRTPSAARVASLAGAEDLAKAWTAVIKSAKNARALLDAVPDSQRSAGWHFASAKQLRRAGKYKDAAAEVLKAPTDPDRIIDGDAWWVERRVLLRELLDIRDYGTAYRIASRHAAEKPAMAADAEFHAGWIALRMLEDPTVAARHFRRITELADGPISSSRGQYWLGRAIEAGAPGDARTAYEAASRHGTAFYGQLAAQKLGRDTIAVEPPAPSKADRLVFEAREVVVAIRRAEEAGVPQAAARLQRQLADELERPEDLALMAEMAERRGDHYLALRIGKSAAARGIRIGALAHPTGAIPDDANLSGAGRALAYAIARQESEFQVGAVSGAGAQGLLQLLPDTARDMAKKAGLPFSKVLLTTDPAYNATLGSEFLSEQLDRFDGSYVLTFAGYNAGPSRARDWMKRYGDPRGQSIEEVVDWIERIPFTETRHYVQRVMENYQVYKMQITGRVDIVSDLVKGR